MSEHAAIQSRAWLRLVQAAAAGLVLIALLYVAMRVWKNVPHLVRGTQLMEDAGRAYVEHPWLAYPHIAPGVLYLLGAPLQLAYRVRSRHYARRRRLGRVLLAAALLSGFFAVVFGARFSFGGAGEAAASVVFGGWFVGCLVVAFGAVRRDDIVRHRRWVIRAFAVGVGVGTIRILVAEWWVRTTPHPPG